MYAWFYGPDGEALIFTDPADIPPGWADAPDKAPTDPLDHDRDGRRGGSFARLSRLEEQ